MIDMLRKSLFSITAAALLCALVRALIPKGRMQRICSLLCGVFVLLSALSGFAGWDMQDFAAQLSKMQMAAEEARTGVEVRNREAIAVIIKSKTEAYILDKAGMLGLAAEVQVHVEAGGSYPYPDEVTVSGRFTPQQQEALSTYIEENLAIGKERQTWSSE